MLRWLRVVIDAVFFGKVSCFHEVLGPIRIRKCAFISFATVICIRARSNLSGARTNIGEFRAIGHWRDSLVTIVMGKILSVHKCAFNWVAAQEWEGK